MPKIKKERGQGRIGGITKTGQKKWRLNSDGVPVPPVSKPGQVKGNKVPKRSR
jgi:hypothetical protein